MTQGRNGLNVPNVLIIGAGGVGLACAHKAAQHAVELGDITVASRTKTSADDVVEHVRRRGSLKAGRKLASARVDAMDTSEVARLIRQSRAGIVINVASPFCNLSIQDACLETGAHYIDTAVHEVEGRVNEPPPWYANYEWPRRGLFEQAGVTAILGCGFDPGAVNAFCAWAAKHRFDRIDEIDIMDVNAGHHGRFFATNFDPETNLREILEDVVYWEDGQWKRIPHHSMHREYDFPEVGRHVIYAMGHDEVHSLAVHFKPKRVQFWMGFSEQYLRVFEVLEKLGLLSEQPVEVDGCHVKPLRLLKKLLPDPKSLAPDYSGEVCIGCLIKGIRDGEPGSIFIYSTCDHAACYREIGAQAISYTTAVPAVTAALLIARGDWNVRRMVNVEELDPDPFLELMPRLGIGWQVREEGA
ncbi:MAG: saccharopine dehydrogenase family protein [Zetaproteobacteria bacterium]|nr:MAG: saccharopine dehydrogenase family protein [Zetaproteobacteria bacterium]